METATIYVRKQKRQHKMCWRFFEAGSSTWARTRDLRINSPSLYRLSYRGIEKKMISTRAGLVKQLLQLFLLGCLKTPCRATP